jgi:hypothetical protein
MKSNIIEKMLREAANVNKNHTTQEIAEFIAKEIQQHTLICHKMQNIRHALVAEEDRYKKNIDAIKKAAIKIRTEECKHWDVEYFPDASGGNDSVYICNDCGLSKKTPFGKQQ